MSTLQFAIRVDKSAKVYAHPPLFQRRSKQCPDVGAGLVESTVTRRGAVTERCQLVVGSCQIQHANAKEKRNAKNDTTRINYQIGDQCQLKNEVLGRQEAKRKRVSHQESRNKNPLTAERLFREADMLAAGAMGAELVEISVAI